jgi:hypothetical protein
VNEGVTTFWRGVFTARVGVVDIRSLLFDSWSSHRSRRGVGEAMSLVGNSAGVVRVSMTPLITVEEMDCAVDKAATLPSPGPTR